jgi:hypothetical protein
MPHLVESNRPGFPFNEVGVGFSQPCPELIWSGSILARGTFKATAKSAAVEVQATFPGWDRAVGSSYYPRPITSIGLHFRRIFGYGPGEWQTSDVKIKDESPAMWSPPSGEDGTYDVRVVAKCTTATDPAAVDKSETTTVRGVVDRVPPSVVAITSGTGDFSNRWVVTATFSEDVVCRGDNWYLDAKIKVGTEPAPRVTVYVCDGPKLIMALSDRIAPPDSSMAVKVSIESGVRDGAGNDIEPVAIELAVGESLRAAYAMNEAIHSKLDITNSDVKSIQETLGIIQNTVVGGAAYAKDEAQKWAVAAAAAAKRSETIMKSQEAQKVAAATAASAAADTAVVAAKEKALLAAEAGVDTVVLAELGAVREALKEARAALAAAKAVNGARHGRDAGVATPENGSTATLTERNDLAALQKMVSLAEKRVQDAELILDKKIAEVVEHLEPRSPLAARLADSQAKLKAATAAAAAAAETDTKASAQLAQAKEAKLAADTKAAASEHQASLDFEKSPLATSEGSSSFKAAEAEAGTVSNANRVAAATVVFVLIAIVLIVAVGYKGYKVVVSHSQATLRAVSLHKGQLQSGAEHPDDSGTLRIVRGSAQEHDNPAFSAMPTFAADASVNALNSPDQEDSDEESSPPIQSVGGAGYYMATATDNPRESTTSADQASVGGAGYYMATATDNPRESPTSANQAGTANDAVWARAPTAWGSGASIVSRPSPNGGPPSVVYQMATADDPRANEVSTEEDHFDSVASLPSPRSRWSKVAGSVRVAAQFQKISHM